jgi:HD-GYP domain-containing protein (c-di-GMP phosphodiesterase class II)
VWIDDSKGLDVIEPIVGKSSKSPALDEEVPLSVPVSGNPAFIGGDRLANTRSTEPISASAEFERAIRICKEAQQAVVAMFEEVRMGKSVDVGGAKQIVDEITDSVTRNPSAIISLARLKSADDYTYMHSVAVCALMVALAKQIKLDENQIQIAGLAGMFHDMGKAVVPLNILHKPSQLTHEEFATIRRHPDEGCAILLSGVPLDPIVLDVCRHHHEKVDGSGYSKGLKNEQVSLHSKMAAVCDVYDAITSNRPYKRGWDPAESLRRMASWTLKFDTSEQLFRTFAVPVSMKSTSCTGFST